MSAGDWKEYAKLVMASLDDHEARIKCLEIALTELKIDMARVMVRYSFLGSLAATITVAVPAVIYWFVSK